MMKHNIFLERVASFLFVVVMSAIRTKFRHHHTGQKTDLGYTKEILRVWPPIHGIPLYRLPDFLQSFCFLLARWPSFPGSTCVPSAAGTTMVIWLRKCMSHGWVGSSAQHPWYLTWVYRPKIFRHQKMRFGFQVLSWLLSWILSCWSCREFHGWRGLRLQKLTDYANETLLGKNWRRPGVAQEEGWEESETEGDPKGNQARNGWPDDMMRLWEWQLVMKAW